MTPPIFANTLDPSQNLAPIFIWRALRLMNFADSSSPDPKGSGRFVFSLITGSTALVDLRERKIHLEKTTLMRSPRG